MIPNQKAGPALENRTGQLPSRWQGARQRQKRQEQCGFAEVVAVEQGKMRRKRSSNKRREIHV